MRASSALGIPSGTRGGIRVLLLWLRGHCRRARVMIVLAPGAVSVVAVISGVVVPRARGRVVWCLDRYVISPRGAGVHCRWLLREGSPRPVGAFLWLRHGYVQLAAPELSDRRVLQHLLGVVAAGVGDKAEPTIRTRDVDIRQGAKL